LLFPGGVVLPAMPGDAPFSPFYDGMLKKTLMQRHARMREQPALDGGEHGDIKNQCR
jgi:hypothetical protein